MMRVSFALSVGLLLTSACSDDVVQTSTFNTPSTATDGAADPRGRTDAGARKDAGSGVRSHANTSMATGGGDDVCSSKSIPAKANPPDILIVLDRSLSMLAGRWGPSVTAVENLTSQYESTVSFGLSMFPGPFGGCSTGVLDVPLAVNNAAAVKAVLDLSFPNGVTPTPQALNAALGILGDRNAAGDVVVPPAYVVLVTDGEPDCPDADFPDPIGGAVTATTALMDANIKTYAIGYQLDGIGKAVMDQVATAGGTDHAFPVENPDDLNAAFAAITKDVVRCEFDLDEVPDEPSRVLITIDGQTIKPDPADGWTIDGTKVTLEGGACGTLKDGTAHAVNASIECTPPVYL